MPGQPWRAGRPRITTGDGDALVEPGEVASIHLLIDMTPSVGEYVPEFDSTLYAFYAAKGDVAAGLNWSAGDVSWAMNGDLITYIGDKAVLDPGDHSIRGFEVVQFEGGGPFDRSDPIWIMDITWDPAGDYSPRTVETLIQTLALPERDPAIDDKEIGVYYTFAGGGAPATYDSPDAPFSFQVVPAPRCRVAPDRDHVRHAP